MRSSRGVSLAVLAALVAMLLAGPAVAATKLRVFIGGQQRPDVVRPLLDRYQAAHP
jgi:multiple sugar transport system substrate-binding protein